MLGTQHHVKNQLCLFVICEQAVEKRTSEPLLYSLCLPVSVCESAVQHQKYVKICLFFHCLFVIDTYK